MSISIEDTELLARMAWSYAGRSKKADINNWNVAVFIPEFKKCKKVKNGIRKQRVKEFCGAAWWGWSVNRRCNPTFLSWYDWYAKFIEDLLKLKS